MIRNSTSVPAVWTVGTMLELSHDAVVAQSLDGLVTAWNPAAEKALGYSAAEIVGKEFARIVPLDCRTEESSRAERVRRGEILKDYETIFRHKSGRIVPVLATSLPLRDFAGQVVGLAVFARDLSAEKLGAGRATDAEQNHRLVFRNNPVPMWVHDIETLRFVAVNDAALRLYGYGSEEFCQLTIPDLVPRDLAPAVREQIAEIEAANPGISTHRRKDGTPIHIEISAREMPHAGRIARLVTALDVTARVQADAAARRLNAQLEQQLHERTTRFETAVSELESFSYSVSHDLRAPLRCIHGFARTLAEEHGAQLDAEGRRLLGVIRQETQHMGQLIDDILAFSRVGRQALDPSAINMTELAAGTFQDLMEALPDRALTLQSAALPPASGDRAMIRLVLTNLFANAIKFTGRQSAPTIEITGQEQDGQRLYCIRDNGVGFDPRYTHKLFNVFQRLHSQDEFEGTGVGLAIVQRIIHRHGGRVWAESELDRGAAFFFTLPATAAQPSP